MKSKRQLLTIFFLMTALYCAAYIIKYYIDQAKRNTEIEELQEQFLQESERAKEETEERTAPFSSKDAKPSYMENRVVTAKEYKILKKFEQLHKENTDLMGWITITDTKIFYPVMQTKDNEFYLNHDFKKEVERTGLPFLDKSCDLKKPSSNMLIYGHCQKDGTKFANLLRYKDESYYQSHKFISFDTLYEEATYEVVSAFIVDVSPSNQPFFEYYNFIDFETSEFELFSKSIKELSFYDTEIPITAEDEFLTLSTCEYSQTDGRFVVVAKKMKE